MKKQNETTAALLSQQQESLAQNLDAIVESGLAVLNIQEGFKRIFATAQCIAQLRTALTDTAMEPIMSLQGSRLGFLTDKDRDGGYPVDTVKDAVISASLIGLLPCGNQFNIIAGNMYVTKEGFTYLLRKSGTPYRIDQAVPIAKNDGAIVRTTINWEDNVGKHEKTLEIPVKVNARMGIDAILGKAERKAKCWLYNHLTGSTLTDGEAEYPTTPDTTPTKPRLSITGTQPATSLFPTDQQA